MPTTYSKSKVEYLCRTAAVRGYHYGLNRERPQDQPYILADGVDNKIMSDAVISELRAEGKIPHWE